MTTMLLQRPTAVAIDAQVVYMWDTVNAAGLPLSAPLDGDPEPSILGGYDDGRYANIGQLQSQHPGYRYYAFTVFAQDHNIGDCLDVEQGDATPDQAPGWVVSRRAAGCFWVAVYCSEALLSTVRAAFHTQGVPEPYYIVAAYPGEGPIVPNGANIVGHQYADRGAYDITVLTKAYYDLVYGTPAPPVQPNQPTKETDMSVGPVVLWNTQRHAFQVHGGGCWHKWGVGTPSPDNESLAQVTGENVSFPDQIPAVNILKGTSPKGKDELTIAVEDSNGKEWVFCQEADAGHWQAWLLA